MKKFEKKTYTREFQVEPSKIDKEKRTFEVAFSSEFAVDRGWGMEVLDHSPESVDLSRLLNGAPFLNMHKPSEQIGVVENARIDSDKVGRATVRMSKRAAAEEVFQDILDGIRTKVSTSYEFLSDPQIEKRDGQTDLYRFMKWMPLEISSVSIPADDSVGVGRSRKVGPGCTCVACTCSSEDGVCVCACPVCLAGTCTCTCADCSSPRSKKMKIELDIDKPLPAASVVSTGDERKQHDTTNKGVKIMDEKIVKTPEQLETERLQEIDAIVTHLGTRVPNIAQYKEDAIRMKVPADIFRGTMYTKVTDSKPLEGSKANLDLSEKDQKRYSVTAAIRSCLPENAGKKSFEREVSDAIGKQVGKETDGIFLSPEGLYRTWFENQPIHTRASLTTTSFAAAGALVGTQIQPGQFIDLLRNRMMTAKAGVTMLTGLQQNIAIPKQTAAGTAYWVADDANLTASNPTFGQLNLQPHTVGAYNDYSRLLLMQSTPSIDALVVNDLTTIIALALDKAVIQGTGNAGQPVGILNWPSLTSNSDATISWAKIVQHESDVATANADVATMSWMVLPSGTTGRGLFKTTVKVSAYPVYLMADDGTLNGYPVYVTNQMPASTLLFGDWSQALMAEWGVLNLTVDPYTGSKAGTIRVVAFESVDVGVRQVGAFSAGTSVAA